MTHGNMCIATPAKEVILDMSHGHSDYLVAKVIILYFSHGHYSYTYA